MRQTRWPALTYLTVVALSSSATAKGPSALDLTAMDTSVEPCSDFYQYACGGWTAKNPIPKDESRWGRFEELGERNLLVLRQILEQASSNARRRSAESQKLGDFYASCMDEKAIEKKGLDPVKPLLEQIASVSDKSALPALLATLHAQGAKALFRFSSQPDMKNAKQYIAFADQGGLGLPERDYYLRDDPKSVELRVKYVQHVRTMFELAGEPEEQAAQKAQSVMAIETRLAKASLDLVSRRDPNNRYHKMSVEGLAALSPTFDWSRYFVATATAPKFQSLNVAVPDFARGVSAAVESMSLDEIKAYLSWHLLRLAAPFLPARFVDADFDFYGKTLTGMLELKPRWKRCVKLTDEALGEALGKLYVEKAFGADAKKRTLAMVKAIEAAMSRDLGELGWMSDATKKQALEKLAAVTNKIGYPDKWRDYRALKIVRGDAFGNALRANAFEVNRRLKRIETPVDPREWEMTPPTVNAYYSPYENNINFPAGILQQPFFSKDGDDAINYGGIGSVIGHELTHGFDDQGRKFDGQGNLRDWWTPDDADAFTARAECVVKQYSEYTLVDNLKLNGKLTLGENVADNGGLRISLMALTDISKTKKIAPIDGFTPVQRLFLGWGQVWCQNITPEAARLRVQTDPHSPGRYRVNGTVSNMPEFREAFSCKADAPMVRAESCRVW